MKTYLIVPALMLAALLSCRRQEPAPTDPPTCIRAIINQNGVVDANTSYVAIERYTLQGKHVYVGIADCCDRFNVLFDNTCQVVCAPSGGFSGGGDGKCPDFSREATERTEIWARVR